MGSEIGFLEVLSQLSLNVFNVKVQLGPHALMAWGFPFFIRPPFTPSHLVTYLLTSFHPHQLCNHLYMYSFINALSLIAIVLPYCQYCSEIQKHERQEAKCCKLPSCG